MSQKQNKSSYKHKLTDIDNIFGFYLVTHLTCLTCKYVDMTFDFTNDLILDIIQKKKTVNYDEPSDD